MEKTPETPSTAPKNDSVQKPSTGLIVLGIIMGLIGLGLITYFVIIPYFAKQKNFPLTTTSTPSTDTTKLPENIPTTNEPNNPPPPTSEPVVFTNLQQEFPELINATYGLFSPRAKELLKKNKFVAVPGATEEFFNTYKANSEQRIPNFITTDSLLHTTHLIFNHLGQKIGDSKINTSDFLNTVVEQLKLDSVSAVYVPTYFGSATAAQTILTNERRPFPTAPLTTTSTDSRSIGTLTKGSEKDHDLYFLLPLIQTKPGNLPSFMTNDAWGYKNLNTFLASWTELISSSATSTPLAMTDGIGGPNEEIATTDDRGYVEPEPILYGTIAQIAQQTREKLEKNKKISTTDRILLTSLEKTSLTLKAISESEINKIPLTEEAHQFIKKYGEWLENTWEQVYAPDLAKTGNQSTVLATHPAAKLATAATLPQGTVLHTGTGKIFDLFVIVTVNGKQKLARGGIYSYYEFSKPTAERLTRTDWLQLISNSPNNLPSALPTWTNSYLDTTALEMTK